MGYLYYGNYCLLYEIGRSEAMRQLGISYRQMEEDIQVMMPVMAVQSRYAQPIKYDELVTIRTILNEMPTKMITFQHEIYSEQGTVAHKGEVKLFFVDMKSNKRVSAPTYLTDKLEQYFD